MRVTISTEMMRWARERARLEPEDLHQFDKLLEWEQGRIQPPLKQLEKFAKSVHVPIGFLFLSEPPEESLPIGDFCTFDNQQVTKPSPILLETIYHCQERQSWYREFAQITCQKPLEFIGSTELSDRPERVAAKRNIKRHM